MFLNQSCEINIFLWYLLMKLWLILGLKNMSLSRPYQMPYQMKTITYFLHLMKKYFVNNSNIQFFETKYFMSGRRMDHGQWVHRDKVITIRRMYRWNPPYLYILNPRCLEHLLSKVIKTSKTSSGFFRRLIFWALLVTIHTALFWK